MEKNKLQTIRIGRKAVKWFLVFKSIMTNMLHVLSYTTLYEIRQENYEVRQAMNKVCCRSQMCMWSLHFSRSAYAR